MILQPFHGQRPFTGQLLAIPGPFIGHVAAICQPPTILLPFCIFVGMFGLAAMCRPFPGHLPAIYRPFTSHLPAIYWPFSGHLPAIYKPFAGHLPAASHCAAILLFCIHFMADGHLHTIHQPFATDLVTAGHFTTIFQTCSVCNNFPCLQPVCGHFHFATILHSFFVHLPPIFGHSPSLDQQFAVHQSIFINFTTNLRPFPFAYYIN